MFEVDVAVVGATGAVGKEMIAALEHRHFPVGKIYPLASERSLGKTVPFRGEELPVLQLESFDFSKVQLSLFSAGALISKEYAPKATAANSLVVDNSSCFRYDKDVPLVVPEVNPEIIKNRPTRGIVANPNCSTIQMVVALKPLHDAAKILRINVVTYQAVAGAGARAIDELEKQSADVLSGKHVDPQILPVQIAFNVIPHIDDFQENGYTKEEMKMVWETQKILGDDSILVNPTAARVPVFYGHSEAIHVEFEKKLTAERARVLLAEAPGVSVIDEHVPGGYPSASEHAAGGDEVFVGRVREDITCQNGLNLWVVSDSVRKGGALNAVQIAEILIANELVRSVN